MTSDAFVLASPVSVGHVRPLMPLARRLVERGLHVVWAISGDESEPAAVWREQIEQLGVRFVNVDDVAPFVRCNAPEVTSGGLLTGLYRRIVARANDITAAATDAIRAAIDGRRIVGGLYDYFALWGYVAMRRLEIAQVDVVISAFPEIIDAMPPVYVDDAFYRAELVRLGFDELPRGGIVPRDEALRVLSFTSPRLCPDAPAGIRLLGVQREALPRAGAIPDEHRPLAERLARAREAGERVVLLSMGTVVTRMFARSSPAHVAFLKRLYSTFAASALKSGALVVASTCDSSAADFGVDEATLGPTARERVIAMPFVPQPLLFAHGLVDVMLMHGGANTFHEAVVSGIPLLVCPGFGDQRCVARAVGKLGVGVGVESMDPLEGSVSLESATSEVLPAMLAPGTSTWKAAAASLAEHVRAEDGLGAAEALVVGR